jgi:iron complex transport system substrate-binding protein
VRLFFQVWQKPLLTINGTQIISDVIRLCGGRNIFAEDKLLVPTVDVEAVVSANPEAVVRTGKATDPESAFEPWRKLPDFRPTATGNLVLLKTDALGRQSPRILDGAAVMCEELERVRARRPL